MLGRTARDHFKKAVVLIFFTTLTISAFAEEPQISDLNDSGSATRQVSVPAKPETEAQRLQRLIDNGNRVRADLVQQVNSQEQEITELRGMVEQNSYTIKQLQDNQRQLVLDLDKLRSQFESTKAASSVAATADKGNFSSKTAKASPEEQQAYQAAVDLILKQRDYDGAISAFTDFQKKYPNSAFDANSSYWLGQLYFIKKQDINSAKNFAAVVKDKDSPKRAAALAKLGDIAKRHGKADAAKKYYQQVLAEYPDSKTAQTLKKSIK